MMDDKEELLLAWDLLRQLEKVESLLWNRYTTAFMELDRAEIERRLKIESDSATEGCYPF